ncbi:hypothetical protein DCCM_3899 [Desulfocucumis palustris]|uniref:Uncharacterized protein n=1 Tax=Desulfocucumis palustris TaxID=1898651 RepID=A0A2L2XEI6_9FIRM|nr:hypothetical protein DCCM_3899 [Desulfocucumis palustris]
MFPPSVVYIYAFFKKVEQNGVSHGYIKNFQKPQLIKKHLTGQSGCLTSSLPAKNQQ